MKVKNTHWIILFWTCYAFGFSQSIIPSTTYARSCYNKHECYSISNSSLVFFNKENSELIVKINFNKFKLGVDTLDEWLIDLSESNFVFKGNLNSNDLLQLSHHNSKPIMVNGLIHFNNISKLCNIELTVFEIPKDALLFKENSQDYFDRVNVNMQLAFYPKDFNIDKKNHHYKKSITLAIYRGYINELKPSMEFLIKDK